jgi:carbonic anhydrase
MNTLTRRRFAQIGAGAAAGLLAFRGLAAAVPSATDVDSAESVWAELREGNLRFVAGASEAAGTRSARGPRAIVVGCADSAHDPLAVFDRPFGEIFVVRTWGAVADRTALGSVEYALERFRPPLLVVLGHERCATVAGALSGQPPVASAAAALPVLGPALAPLRSRATRDLLLGLGVGAAVDASARALVRDSRRVRGEVEAGRLTIVRALTRSAAGEVARLG